MAICVLKPKYGYHHEAHKEHEGRKHFFKIRYPLHYPIFVFFATFVVLKSFVEWTMFNGE